jgi:hypothetical protein
MSTKYLLSPYTDADPTRALLEGASVEFARLAAVWYPDGPAVRYKIPIAPDPLIGEALRRTALEILRHELEDLAPVLTAEACRRGGLHVAEVIYWCELDDEGNLVVRPQPLVHPAVRDAFDGRIARAADAMARETGGLAAADLETIRTLLEDRGGA